MERGNVNILTKRRSNKKAKFYDQNCFRISIRHIHVLRFYQEKPYMALWTNIQIKVVE